jgi:XisH protein
MAKRDLYHNTVVNALKKAGWTITHDPLIIPFGGQNLFVDLGAEKLIAAERAGQQIAVEIKSFLSPSGVSDLEDALGQYILLQRKEPDRVIYLAVPITAYMGIFRSPIGEVAIADFALKLLIFEAEQEVIVQWIE